MAAPVRTLCCSVWRQSCRQLSSSCSLQGGQKWRMEHGIPKSGSEYGLFTDLPDWSFADGRPAPPSKGMLKRRERREELSKRIVMLDKEIDKGMESWQRQKEEAVRMEKHQQSLLLKPKGKLLIKKTPKT